MVWNGCINSLIITYYFYFNICPGVPYMKFCTKFGLIIFIFLLSVLPGLSFAGTATDIKGIWQGALNINGSSLRIVFRIFSEDSHLKAEMDSPDQGVKGIHVDSVIFNNDSLKIYVNFIQGYFEGKLFTDSNYFKGVWNQRGFSLPLNLKKTDKVAGYNRPQEPKPPFPYTSEDVIFDNKPAGIKLAGTLTMPKTGGLFAAVVLISGTGPQNRDEELYEHKPFLVLADYLTRKGIAVLRVDDRGTGKSTGNFSESNDKDFESDVIASIEYLKTREEIDKKKIGLIGHSEGGMIAPAVAVHTKDVAFIVLMAGPGIPCDSLLYLQSKALAKAAGYPEEQIKESLEINKKIYNAVKTGADSLSIVKELRKIFDESNRAAGANSGALFEKELKIVMSPWFRYFISYDPAPVLEKVKCPVLALNGSKDLQVPPDENLAGIKKALKKSENKNYEVKELNGLNHLFQTAGTGNMDEYIKIEETIAPSALEIISGWILKITKE